MNVLVIFEKLWHGLINVRALRDNWHYSRILLWPNSTSHIILVNLWIPNFKKTELLIMFFRLGVQVILCFAYQLYLQWYGALAFFLIVWYRHSRVPILYPSMAMSPTTIRIILFKWFFVAGHFKMNMMQLALWSIAARHQPRIVWAMVSQTINEPNQRNQGCTLCTDIIRLRDYSCTAQALWN